ncbi:MAG: hypothetical protein M5R36_09675 [Deltaproteobacteria bacterium]|nr:hypothetical protein [Deltaproteobacteria bacterium]
MAEFVRGIRDETAAFLFFKKKAGETVCVVDVARRRLAVVKCEMELRGDAAFGRDVQCGGDVAPRRPGQGMHPAYVGARRHGGFRIAAQQPAVRQRREERPRGEVRRLRVHDEVKAHRLGFAKKNVDAFDRQGASEKIEPVRAGPAQLAQQHTKVGERCLLFDPPENVQRPAASEHAVARRPRRGQDEIDPRPSQKSSPSKKRPYPTRGFSLTLPGRRDESTSTARRNAL